MKTFDLSKDVIYTSYQIQEQVFPNFFDGGDVKYFLEISENRNRYYNHFTSGSFSGGYYTTYYASNFSGSSIESSNAIFDLTIGTHPSSSFLIGKTCGFLKQKNKIYRLFAQKLLGNANNIFSINGKDRHDLIFLSLKRNQYKQGIVPGTFAIRAITSGSWANPVGQQYFEYALAAEGTELSLGYGPSSDQSLRKNEFSGLSTELNSQTFISASLTANTIHQDRYVKVYYDQGIVVCDVALFNTSSGPGGSNHWYKSSAGPGAVSSSFSDLYITTGSNDFNVLLAGCLQRVSYVFYTNYTKPRKTIYTCVAKKEEFNYSSNPTFVNDLGEIRTTSGSINNTLTTYITKVGLLGPNKEIIAVGNLNKPIKKDPTREITIKVKLDF